jgi:hypothetical protein
LKRKRPPRTAPRCVELRRFHFALITFRCGARFPVRACSIINSDFSEIRLLISINRASNCLRVSEDAFCISSKRPSNSRKSAEARKIRPIPNRVDFLTGHFPWSPISSQSDEHRRSPDMPRALTRKQKAAQREAGATRHLFLYDEQTTILFQCIAGLWRRG